MKEPRVPDRAFDGPMQTDMNKTGECMHPLHPGFDGPNNNDEERYVFYVICEYFSNDCHSCICSSVNREKYLLARRRLKLEQIKKEIKDDR